MEPKAPESEIKPIVEDPRQLFDGFRKSDTYNAAFNKFFDGKQLAEDVTAEEKREAFERGEEATSAFHTFAQHDILFHYNPNFYPREIQTTITEYITFVKDLKKLERVPQTREQILTHDTMRASFHTKAGRMLAEHESAPSYSLGKKLLTLILIEKRLESFGATQETNLQRQQKVLAA